MKWVLQMPRIVLWIIAGALMGVAFLHQFLWWTMFLGLPLFLWCISNISSPKKAFLYGWLTGSIKMLFVFSFIWAIYPLDWLGIESVFVQTLIVLIYWIFVPITLGIGVGFISYFFVKLNLKKKWFYMLFFPILLVLGEVAGAFVYSFATLGPGSLISAVLSYGHTGYVFANHSIFKYIAKIGGVYSLTIFAGFVALFIVYIPKLKILDTYVSKFILYLVAIIFILGGFFTINVPVFENISVQKIPTERIAVFTTDFDNDVLYSKDLTVLFLKQKMLIDALKETLRFGVATVILPETTRLSELISSDKQILKFLQNESVEDVVLIDNVRIPYKNGSVSRAKIYDTKTDAVYEFDKQFLVALGEYVPYVASFIIDFIYPSNNTQNIIEGMILKPGINQKTVDLPDNIPNVLFCYESSAPWKVKSIVDRRNVNNRPSYVAYTVSNSWANEGIMKTIFWNQMDSMLKIQALWSGVSILESANLSPSAYYKPDGTRGELKKIYQNSYIRVDVVEI